MNELGSLGSPRARLKRPSQGSSKNEKKKKLQLEFFLLKKLSLRSCAPMKNLSWTCLVSWWLSLWRRNNFIFSRCALIIEARPNRLHKFSFSTVSMFLFFFFRISNLKYQFLPLLCASNTISTHRATADDDYDDDDNNDCAVSGDITAWVALNYS